MQDARFDALGEAEHVDRSHHARLHGLDRIVLVMNRRGGAGEIVDLIDFEQDRLDHIMAQQLETAVIEQVRDVLASPGKEVVEADHFVAFAQQSLAQMRADKTCAAGDENPHACTLTFRLADHVAK